MLYHYYVNKNSTGNPNYNHEVHKDGCQWMPSVENRIYLGYFSSCSEALTEARKHYANVDGCVTCCSACHRWQVHTWQKRIEYSRSTGKENCSGKTLQEKRRDKGARTSAFYTKLIRDHKAQRARFTPRPFPTPCPCPKHDIKHC